MHKPVILVDEMNIMYQLHRMNVRGFAHWSTFYQTIESMIGNPCVAHFFCANVMKTPEMEQVHQKRADFFNALRESSIQVHEGFSVLNANKRNLEKGVDVLLAMEIYKASLAGVRDIFLCSADSGLYPAIKEAQSNGSRVHLIISDYASAKEIESIVDSTISLESVLTSMQTMNYLKWKDNRKPFIFSSTKLFERKGLVV